MLFCLLRVIFQNGTKKGLKQETNVAFKVIQDSQKETRWLTGRVSVENMEFKKAQKVF